MIFAFCLLLAGCGPREIGQDSSHMPEGEGRMQAAEQMRLPLTGSGRTEWLLYQYNRPEVVENIRDWRINQFNRHIGQKPSPEDPAYREIPQQRSPFRQ